MNLAELEAFKFAEVKDKEQYVFDVFHFKNRVYLFIFRSQEEVEKMNNAIEEQKYLKESYDNEVQRINEQLFIVREHLYKFILKLEVLTFRISPMTN